MPPQIVIFYPEIFSEKLKFLQCRKVKFSVLCSTVGIGEEGFRRQHYTAVRTVRL